MDVFKFFKKKSKAEPFPFLVDVHSHLLPKLDDGVKSWQESLEILKIFKQLGYHKVITTPHVMQDYYPNTKHSILAQYEKLYQLIEKYNLDIVVEVAAEYYLDENLMAGISGGERLLTFGKDYLLFETSFMNKPAFLEEAIFAMYSHGYKPVLAHPERYAYLQSNPALLQKLKDMEVYFQMNMLSLTGFYNDAVKKLAKQILKRKYVNFVGSDCHSLLHATTLQKNCHQKMIKLMQSNLILNDRL